MGEAAGIDRRGVTAWLAEAVGTVGELSFGRLEGGHSNLTYRVDDEVGRTVVLRRPPLGDLLPTAHDMGREYRLIDALAATDVPVPAPLAHCTDESVIGAPFYVMSWVEGTVLHTDQIAERSFDADERAVIGRSFVDVLGRLHRVDPDAVGLGDLSRPDGYVERQLRRWWRQYEASRTHDDAQLHDLHAWLLDRVPEQGPARVVHGDYRLGNCLTGADARIAAVLDWEIATLGDPLADLGYVLATWPQPDDDLLTTSVAPSLAPGFPGRDEVLERYAEASGADTDPIEFYVAWAYWKIACISQGVYARYCAGQLSGDGVDIEAFRRSVEAASELGTRAAKRYRPR